MAETLTDEEIRDINALLNLLASDVMKVLSDFDCDHGRMYFHVELKPGTRILRPEIGSECQICSESQKAAIPVVARIILRREKELLDLGITLPRAVKKFE